MNKKIYVTQPTLPDLSEFTKSLEQIWKSKWLTNNGLFHQEFEKKLAEFLGVQYISLFANGTLALLTSLQALDITGEVITTPYTFVATAHSIMWNNLTPVFCDIEPVYGNIDINKIEQLITEKTTAILPVHVYGNPVDVEKIELIAQKHKLKVIYDAAHAFNVKKDGNSILNYGDLSVLSFHSTKVFNTIEGGAIISHNKETKQHIDDLKNFGFRNETTVVAAGINGKMNELQAAYGLLQIKNIKNQIASRKKITNIYRQLLNNIIGINFYKNIDGVEHNYAYFPIFISDKYKMSRDELYNLLKSNNIFGRRYFYPLISNIPTYKELPSSNINNLPVANKLANQVICLPIYPDLQEEEIMYICNLIKGK